MLLNNNPTPSDQSKPINSAMDLFSSNEALSNIPESDYNELLAIINRMGLDALFSANDTSTEERMKIIQDIYELYVVGNVIDSGCNVDNVNGSPARNPDGSLVDGTIFPPLARWHHERHMGTDGRVSVKYIPTTPDGDYDFTIEIDDDFMVNTEADIWGLVEGLKDSARELELGVYEAIGKYSTYDTYGGSSIITGDDLETLEDNKNRWYNVIERVAENKRAASGLMNRIVDSSIIIMARVRNFVSYVKSHDNTGNGTGGDVYTASINTLSTTLEFAMQAYTSELHWASAKLVDESSSTEIEIKSLDDFYSRLIEGYDTIKDSSSSLRKFINEVRPVQYKSVKSYFSFIKGLEESTKAINDELISEVEKIKEQRLSIINDGIISNSEHQILPIDSYTEYGENSEILYIFDNVDSKFITLDEYTRLSKENAIIKAINDLYIQSFKNEESEIIPRANWADILGGAYKNFNTDTGVLVIDDKLYNRFNTSDPYVLLHNIYVPSRNEALNGEFEVYFIEVETEEEIIEEVVSYDDHKDYISNLYSYIEDSFDVEDKAVLDDGYMKFKENVINSIILRGQLHMNLANILDIINSSEIEYIDNIKEFLSESFITQMSEYIVENGLTDLDNIEGKLNEFVLYYVNDDGDKIYINEKIVIRKDISESLVKFFNVTLNTSLYPMLSKSFTSNVGGVLLTGDEISIVSSLAKKLDIYYSYQEHCRILIDRIIESNQDYNIVREVKFIRVPYNTRDIESSITDTTDNDIFKFHEITSKDKYWKDKEEDVVQKDFNVLNSKFYSIEDNISEYVTINQLSYMFNSLTSFDNNINYDNQMMFIDGDINPTPIDLSDGIISMGILINRISGMNTDPIYEYSDIKYLFGFNNFNDNDYFIKDINDSIIQYQLGSTGPALEGDNWFIGNCIDIYQGQYVKAHYLDGGAPTFKELIVKEVIIDSFNANLSRFRTFNYVDNNNSGVSSTDDGMVTIELIGIDVDTSDNASGVTGHTHHFNRFSTVEELVDNYHILNGSYSLSDIYMKTEIGNMIKSKDKLSEFLTNVNSQKEYDKLHHFYKLQTQIKYSRDMYEIPAMPGTYFSTYLEYLEDNVNYVGLVSWLKSDEILNFNTLTDMEKKDIYKDKLIRIIDDMVSYVSDPTFASYFNNTNYIFYIKSMIKTVLVFFKSYTIDILPVDTKFVFKDYNNQNIKIDDSYNINEKKVIDNIVNFSEIVVSEDKWVRFIYSINN